MPQSPATPESMLRPEVLGFEAYHAGLSIEAIQEKYGLAQVVKLASNENPLGASPLVQEVLKRRADSVFRYPRSRNPGLVRAIAERMGAAEERIVVGNGSDELIDLLIRVRANPGRDNILAFDPCFSMYQLQARLCGVEFRQVPLNSDFSFPWADFLARVDERTAIAFVTTPDNPTGYAPPVEELETLARALPETCLLVVDEAYMDFAEPQERYSLAPRAHQFPNLVILRTFSKMYGLAGLRLGFGLMPEWLADYVWRVRMPFSVNLMAEEAGKAALADEVFFAETRRVTLNGRDFLVRELGRLGCETAPTQANFLLVKAPEASGFTGRRLFEALLPKGVIIRPLDNYGLPAHVRVSVGAPHENARFIEALAEVLDA